MDQETDLLFDDIAADLNGRGEAIVRRHLHDELLARLRDIIVNGELAPGAKVPEKELCERFGVSRTPLREALKVLAFEGLVLLTPNRGATVAPLTVADLEETFPVVGTLEALAGELACERITDEEIAEIRRLHEEMVGHYRRRDLQPYFALNEQIHLRIQASARNDTLANLFRSVSSRIRRARLLANMSDARWAQAVAEHEQIIEALEARDGKRLSRILKEHIANKFASLRKAIAAGEQAAEDATPQDSTPSAA